MTVENTTIESSLFGRFNPLQPQNISGYFSYIVFAEPVEIDASIELVWSVITDFSAYPLWNPLNRSFQLDTVAKPGEKVTFDVSWGPYTKDNHIVPVSDLQTSLTQHETLTVWQPNQCLAYADDLGTWHRAERIQYISQLPNNRTRYHTYERWAGLITPIISLLYSKKAQMGFNANSQALKTRAETLAKDPSNQIKGKGK